ncbi:MAG: DUF4382 domain-containing protein [Armatimonadota bacterium]
MSRRPCPRTLAYLAGPLIVLALLMTALTGCGGGGGDVADTGRVQIAMTDAVGPYASVVVSVKEIRVVPVGDEDAATGPALPLVGTLSPSRVIDVLTLQFAQTLLAEANVPAGAYCQVRLVLDPNPVDGDPVNYVTMADAPDVKLPLTTPSGQQSGLKINGTFDVAAGNLTALVLDFDPNKAVVSAGNSGRYLLKPTGIRVVSAESILTSYAAISGTVLPAEAWSSAVVSIIPQNAIVPFAVGGVNPEDGTFRAFVPAGVYTVNVTADGYNTYDSLEYTASIGTEVDAGTITLTIPAPPPPDPEPTS